MRTESRGSKRYYTDYCNHMWRFYIRNPNLNTEWLEREADRRAFRSCEKVFSELTKNEQAVIREYHELDINIPFMDRVGTVSSVTCINSKDVCGILARVNTKLAEARGLV